MLVCFELYSWGRLHTRVRMRMRVENKNEVILPTAMLREVAWNGSTGTKSAAMTVKG